MITAAAPQDAVAPRDPRIVMRLERLGCFHQSRLSFLRQMLRRLKSEGWRFERAAFEIGADGVGHAVYAAHGPQRSYALVAFAHDLPDELRSDRVIAEAWDTTFTLFDGIPEPADIARLARNVPLQEAGRISGRELSLSRANRSARLWEHVVESLAAGRQPCAEKLNETGYLMRTTAVYGSGKFGAADREAVAERPECRGPFQIEMLAVWLIRAFVADLAEHMARSRAPETAVALDPALRRRLGIGNSTGLGMAPFLVNHPTLLHSWICARETALARVRSQPGAEPDEAARFRALVARARLHAARWRSAHPLQERKIESLRDDLEALDTHLRDADLHAERPWNRLWLWAEGALGMEGQEQLASLLLEVHGSLVDDLCDAMSADESKNWRIDGRMDAHRLREMIEERYDWALELDWSDPAATARVWYVSEEKLEPRLGERAEEPLDPYEQPLAPGRDAARLHHDLQDAAPGESVAAFVLRRPEHRHIVRRIQATARRAYAEIRDNTVGAGMLPIDMLRLKLSFFGACHFDPRSDRWVRINLFQNAPYPDELAALDAEDWTLPPLEERVD